jgi:hypothetical protein
MVWDDYSGVTFQVHGIHVSGGFVQDYNTYAGGTQVFRISLADYKGLSTIG